MKEIKEFRKSLLSKVVRMEAIEAKFGIEINHLTLITEPDSEYIDVNFELLAKNGSSIDDDIYINFAFYDEDENICEKDDLCIYAEDFGGFSVESTTCNINTCAKNISKIVFYVSKA